MRKTIYKSMCIVIAFAIVITTLLNFAVYYKSLKNNIEEYIKDDGKAIANLLNAQTSKEEYQDILNQMLKEYDYNRITIIDKNGQIIFDNEADPDTMQNHMDREEIQNAFSSGYGQSKRKSQTMGVNVYYYAYLLNDGSVLRISKEAEDIYYVFLRIIPLGIIIIIFILALAFYFTKRITTNLMKPINELDLDDLSNTKIYEEFMPFVKRIDHENKIKAENEKIRREFSANVSHELKTPLTSITGYAQMINNGMAKNEDILTFTNKIEKEANRLLLLINDIIELSNLDERGIVTEDDVEVSAVVHESIMALENAADRKNVSIYYSGSEAHIKGSRTMISELAYNIIDNAIKYNKYGGSVTVFVGVIKGNVEISVKDTGIGIPDSDKERIFERFYRVDKSHSKKVGGTGLGLSIVKHIAMCHNADITVKSELGFGTTISVVFKENKEVGK